MKKVYTAIVPVLALAASLIALAPAKAHASATLAPASSTECSVVSTGSSNTAGNADSRFIVNNDGTVSATFEVKGKDCKVSVVLASWQTPDADKGRPYDQQKLYKHVGDIFTTGKHTLTVELPACYYQVDLARGKTPTGPNGSAVYEKGRLMGSLHGGTKKCEETPSTPATPQTTTTTSSPQAAATMPSTGAGDILGIFAGTSALGALAHRLIAHKRRAS